MKISSEIKEFLEHGGRCLLIEDGEPRFVISSFEEYLGLLHKTSQETARGDSKLVAEINRDIETLMRRDSNAAGEGNPRPVFYAE